jgi:hypothetical protein
VPQRGLPAYMLHSVLVSRLERNNRVLELAFVGQVHVPLWLPVAVAFLSAMTTLPLPDPPFRIVYLAILNAPALLATVVAAMIRSLALVVTIVGVA